MKTRLSRISPVVTSVAASMLLCSSAAAQEAPGKADSPGAGSPGSPAETADAGEGDAGSEKRKFQEMIEKLGWQREGTGKLGNQAEVTVPQGYRFATAEGARGLLKLYGNLTGSSEQGLIAPENLDWFIVFDWDASGYVKDDEKDKLDADAILKEKQANEKPANEARKEAGLGALYVEGWKVAPHYDEATNCLEWGVLLRDEQGDHSVNYNIKLLGREGVMDATLVCDPEVLDSALPVTKKLITGFKFTPGHTYGEYRKGDKIAQYGLTGLILGGGAVLAGKAGLFAVIGKFFAKLGKLVIVLVIGVVAVIGKFIRKLLGKGEPT